MQNKPLTLAYSTCPNDTFIFHALAERLVDMRDLAFVIDLADVEALNRAAAKGTYAVSKLSFAAIGHLQGCYRILNSGAALGRGCGPLVVARPDFDATRLADARIAVPGLWTTANLLLGLYLGRQIPVETMAFDQVMPAVAAGQVDAGVIIHEGRFTYPEYNLVCLQDLGQWWEDETGHPIPLGAIAVREDVDPETAGKVNAVIRSSIEYAAANPEASRSYVREHAQEMETDVIRQHISLYVNAYSVDLRDEGRAAIGELFLQARKRGIFKELEAPMFAMA
jgi:1,4-dihydroxy-6-naphthoate synthase